MMQTAKYFIMVLAVSVLTSFKLPTAYFVPVDNLQIRIFAHLKLNSFQIALYKGTFNVLADGNSLFELKHTDNLLVKLAGDSVELQKNDQFAGKFRYLKFIAGPEGELRMKLVDPERKARVYQDNLGIGVSDGGLRVINEVSLDNYIAGVTEAEAGARSAAEFYKVQAILARTFALAHINKHIAEGYSLCDQVHCQAYFGKPRDLSIFKAVKETRGKVVVDENLNLIIAAFHSNSGGQTANSEDVWGARTSYLRSIDDSFSVKMPNAKWERKMPVDDWLTYLHLKHNFPVDKADARLVALNFNQESRKVFLEYGNIRIPLKNVRVDLQLKSSFFDIRPLGADSVILIGKGYGHGLGMCQEGAMCMVKMGYSYIAILNYYYQGIQLIDLNKLNFFRDE
jgi:stage II sporulation protein D